MILPILSQPVTETFILPFPPVFTLGPTHLWMK